MKKCSRNLTVWTALNNSGNNGHGIKQRIAETLKGSVNKASGNKILLVMIKLTIGRPWVAVSPALQLCSSPSRLEGGWFLGPVYTESQRQCRDDASDAALIETNGVAPFWRDSIVFQWKQYHQRHRRIVAALTLTLGVNWPLFLKQILDIFFVEYSGFGLLWIMKCVGK